MLIKDLNSSILAGEIPYKNRNATQSEKNSLKTDHQYKTPNATMYKESFEDFEKLLDGNLTSL